MTDGSPEKRRPIETYYTAVDAKPTKYSVHSGILRIRAVRMWVFLY